ncbi:MAG: leucine-rich repeat domain-containing protein [Bacteroidetes bacterium]|nr:leucine-rich repeat domain-containing protein [Bacteroidota bacterium]
MKRFLLLAVLLIIHIILWAQPKPEVTLTAQEVEEYRNQARMLVQYFEGTLNFLGDPESTVHDKEIIINESWDKIFVNENVQIEDDLDDRRDVPVNKDVRAYLKDVDFFFRHAVFAFDILSIDPMVGQQGQFYFLVSLNRRLNARALNGDTIRSIRPRFIEINLDPFKKDLRIASYYTTKLNEREELRHWWSALSQEWRDFFGANLLVFDSIPLSRVMYVDHEKVAIRRILTQKRTGRFFVAGNDTLPESKRHLLYGRRPDTTIVVNDVVRVPRIDTTKTNPSEVDNRLRQLSQRRELNIDNQIQLNDLSPLSQLRQLETVSFANVPAVDLSPLRNLSRLRTVNMRGSLIGDLSAFTYAINLRELDFSHTRVTDIAPLAHLRQLEKVMMNDCAVSSLEPLATLDDLIVVEASGTRVSSLEPLANLKNLRMLNVSRTQVSSLEPLRNIKSLQQLNVENTGVADLQPIAGLAELNTLMISNTLVGDLSPLQNLAKLRLVYSDNNQVSLATATAFMRLRPDVLLMFNSEELQIWWRDLPIAWKALLAAQGNISQNPGKEELHKLLNLRRLDLTATDHIQDIEPLRRLFNLQELLLAGTRVTGIAPLESLNNLRYLDISGTAIYDLQPLHNCFLLEELHAGNTSLRSLSALHDLKNLRLVVADRSQVTREEVVALRERNPRATVVYQTDNLRVWWNNLAPEWRELLAQDMQLPAQPTGLQLQTLVDRTELRIRNTIWVSNLEPLMPLLWLEHLELTGTPVSDLGPLSGMTRLRSLDLSGNPVTDLRPLSNLKQLEQLNLEGNPVSDLSPIAQLHNMRNLNISGTQVRHLRALAGMSRLEELSLYNTRIRSLAPADKIASLKHVRCYNTRIPRSAIEKVRKARPDLNILYY